jgi:aminoglycoside phosphotransferase (APT) family kinase protein
VQELVDGSAPDARWVDAHIDAVGRLISRYHEDAALAQMLSPLTALEFVRSLGRRFDVQADAMAPDLRQLLGEAIGAITELTAQVPAEEMVVTHGDPNTSNLMLGTNGTLYLVDWDEARISDPLRDTGQVLWWYVRAEQWAAGLGACGLADNAAIRQRIYWWAAAESADVALELIDEGNAAAGSAFARDARAAVRREVNPRAWWLTGEE